MEPGSDVRRTRCVSPAPNVVDGLPAGSEGPQYKPHDGASRGTSAVRSHRLDREGSPSGLAGQSRVGGMSGEGKKTQTPGLGDSLSPIPDTQLAIDVARVELDRGQ